jgi:outer membrane protein OmpA-like peptidoglycan-associated protein
MPDNTLVPFIAVGGGGTNFNIPQTPSMKNGSAGLVDYGGGIKYFVASDVALRGDVRHAILLNDSDHNNLEYSVGLTLQFGGVRKTAAPIAAEGDTTIPTIIFTAPVNGATMVSVNQKTNVAFSEDMDTTTISSETFTLKQGSTLVPGSVTATGSTATFTPTDNYESGKVYTAIVTTGAKDLAGNGLANNYMWEFNAGPTADTTAPTVTFTSPIKGDRTTPVNQKVNAAFSENMDPATISGATFIVTQGSTPVAGKVTSNASTATFTPARTFEKGKAYTATVTTGAKDLSGNALANNYVWDFTAYQAPKVIGVLATLENSHFDFDSAAISENGKTILNHNVKSLKSNPAMKLRIAGYTSASGSEEYNQDLSERRAESVKEYLVKTGGIDSSRLATIGYGKTNPAKHEVNPADKLSAAAFANMRVVIEIIEE